MIPLALDEAFAWPQIAQALLCYLDKFGSCYCAVAILLDTLNLFVRKAEREWGAASDCRQACPRVFQIYQKRPEVCIAVFEHAVGKKYKPICCGFSELDYFMQIGIFGMYEVPPSEEDILDSIIVHCGGPVLWREAT